MSSEYWDGELTDNATKSYKWFLEVYGLPAVSGVARSMLREHGGPLFHAFGSKYPESIRLSLTVKSWIVCNTLRHIQNLYANSHQVPGCRQDRNLDHPSSLRVSNLICRATTRRGRRRDDSPPRHNRSQGKAATGQAVIPALTKAMRFPLRPGKGSFGTKRLVKANHFMAQLSDKDLHHYESTMFQSLRKSHRTRPQPSSDQRADVLKELLQAFPALAMTTNSHDVGGGEDHYRALSGGNRLRSSFDLNFKEDIFLPSTWFSLYESNCATTCRQPEMIIKPSSHTLDSARNCTSYSKSSPAPESIRILYLTVMDEPFDPTFSRPMGNTFGNYKSTFIYKGFHISCSTGQ